MKMTKALRQLRIMVQVACNLDECSARRLAVDLLEWFNIAEPNKEEIERLALLVKQGCFRAWNCPTCGQRCYLGSPPDWKHFQGVLNQDYTSYPEGSRHQCNHCRMFNPVRRQSL